MFPAPGPPAAEQLVLVIAVQLATRVLLIVVPVVKLVFQL